MGNKSSRTYWPRKHPTEPPLNSTELGPVSTIETPALILLQSSQFTELDSDCKPEIRRNDFSENVPGRRKVTKPSDAGQHSVKRYLTGSMSWRSTALVATHATARSAQLFVNHLQDRRQRLQNLGKVHVLSSWTATLSRRTVGNDASHAPSKEPAVVPKRRSPAILLVPKPLPQAIKADQFGEEGKQLNATPAEPAALQSGLQPDRDDRVESKTAAKVDRSPHDRHAA
jgi:hypothetical protein